MMKRTKLRVQKKQVKRLYLAGQISDEVCAIMLGEIAATERDARRHRAERKEKNNKTNKGL